MQKPSMRARRQFKIKVNLAKSRSHSQVGPGITPAYTIWPNSNNSLHKIDSQASLRNSDINHETLNSDLNSTWDEKYLAAITDSKLAII